MQLTNISHYQFLVRTISYSFIAFCISLNSQDAYSQSWQKEVSAKVKGQENNFYAVQTAFNDYWKDKTPGKGMGYKQFRRWEWFWEQRVNSDGSFPANNVVIKEWQDYEESHKNIMNSDRSTANWTAKGPNASPGGYYGLGRINCMAFHPTDFNTFWVGTPAGGLWKTTNFGATWTTVTDELPVLGVSDIAINPTSPNIMYIATGDGDRGSLSSCTGSPAGDTKSIGILKSTDGGATWNTTGMNWNVQDAKLIRRLIINPNNPNILYAAASDGIWKTTNAGNTWTNIYSGYYFMDIEFKPGNPNTFYASTYDPYGNAEVLITYDAGVSWYVSDILDDVQRINLEVSPASPNLVEGVCANSIGAFAGWIESLDGFNSYSWYAATPGTGNLLSYDWPLTSSSITGQGSYDLAYAINPVNSAERFLGGINTYMTSDGWSSDVTLVSFWNSGPDNPGVQTVHADKHCFAFHPLNPAYFFDCNDGGIYYTTNGGDSWIDISNGLQISQLYRIGNSQSNPEDIMCGLQDNGSKEYYNGVWYEATGGDGMECIIDPSNPNIMYSSYANGVIYRTLNGTWSSYSTISENLPGGQQPGSWVTPYVLDPSNPTIIYAGYEDVYKSSDRGNSWAKLSNNLAYEGTLKSLTVSPSNSQYIYAADFWYVYKSVNGGNSWTTIANIPTNGNISYLAVSPTDPNNLFLTISGYYSGEKVFETMNGGSTWNNISGTLPNLPVNCIVYETGTNKGLYIGTDVGIYYRNASMSDWIYYNNGLPNVVVTELDIQYNSSLIRAATFGRGLWESPLYVTESYLITTVSNPTIGGTTSGGGTFTAGSECTVTATPSANYTFNNWTENGNIVSNNVSYTFTVNENRSLTANFDLPQTYDIITLSFPAAGGTTTGTGTYNAGTQVTVSANTSSGWTFHNWTEFGSQVSTEPNYSFIISSDRNLTANFLEQFIITAIPDPLVGGYTSGGGNYTSGQNATVQAFPNDDYEFLNWLENSTVVSTSPTFSFIVNSDRNLIAAFNLIIGVPNNNNSGISIYPNPTTGLLTIFLPSTLNSKKGSLELINTTGKSIFKLDNNTFEETTVLNLSHLPDGLYNLIIQLEKDKCYQTKIIIRK